MGPTGGWLQQFINPSPAMLANIKGVRMEARHYSSTSSQAINPKGAMKKDGTSPISGILALFGQLIIHNPTFDPLM